MKNAMVCATNGAAASRGRTGFIIGATNTACDASLSMPDESEMSPPQEFEITE